jgi:hypothetical protein
MAYLNEQMKKLDFDVRLKEFNLRQKKITPADWKKHLESLPDLKDEVVVINLRENKESRGSGETN